MDSEGYVTEGSSSNIWIINNDNEIITRALDGQILSGITRKSIAKFADLN
ncbi:aminotransferase class IV, partial [Alphaproteobacteria bacterium]|nr:aminotransferase class IV [Alphaproteobacteria bacterium]